MTFNCDRTCPLFAERWCRFRPALDAMGPVRVDSHIAQIDLEVRDLDALDVACKRLGLVLRRGQQTYKWFGDYVGDTPLPPGQTEADLGKCTHAIGIPNDSKAYEIGVIQKPDGSYGLAWDFFCGGYGLEEVAGAECKKLIAEYTVAVAEQAANAQGWLYERAGDGSLLIHHPSGGMLTVSAGGTLDATGFVGEACHSAMLELGLPMTNMVAKPEAVQVVAKAMVGT